MKVAFVIPFSYEKFFHFANEFWHDPLYMQNEIIRKRNTWHFNWVNSLRQAGIDVTVFHQSMNGKETVEYFHDVYGFRIISVPSLFPFKFDYSFKLLYALSDFRPDIVFSVSHIMHPILDMYDILTFYCKTKKIPIVTRNAHSDTYTLLFPAEKSRMKKAIFYEIGRYIYIYMKFTIKKYLKYFIKRVSLSNSDLVLVQTDFDKTNLVGKFNVQNSKIVVFPKPVDLRLFREISKEESCTRVKLNINKEYLLHVSNLFETKGCEHIIKLIPELAVRQPNVHLLVIGKGPKLKLLIDLVNNLNVSDYVTFLGQVSHTDLVYYYNLSSVFVLPTDIDTEGQPNVILEAIACNTFPISSNMIGPASILTQGLGIVVNTSDYGDMVDKIMKVIRKELVLDQEKRALFLKAHSFDNVSSQLLSCFYNLLP